MPLPLLALGLGLAAASGIATTSQLARARKWKKEQQQVCARAEQVQAKAEEMRAAAAAAGRARLAAAEPLRQALEFLLAAAEYSPEFQPEKADPELLARLTRMKQEADLLTELKLSCGGCPGKADAAAIHAAVGLFGLEAPAWEYPSSPKNIGAEPEAEPYASFAQAGDKFFNAMQMAIAALPFLVSPLLSPVSSWHHANQAKKQAQAAQTAEAQAEIHRWNNLFDAMLRQLSIVRRQVENAHTALAAELRTTDPENPEDPPGIYCSALALSAALNVEAVTPEQAAALGFHRKEEQSTNSDPQANKK